MSKLEKYSKINYDGNEYAVCDLSYKGQHVPVLLEYDNEFKWNEVLKLLEKI